MSRAERRHDIEVVPAAHTDDAPDVVDHDVFMVDFVYNDPETMARIWDQARSLVVLDHHDTAYRTLTEGADAWNDVHAEMPVTEAGLDDIARSPCLAIIDQSHSAIGLVARWCRLTWRVVEPPLFAHIQDRDLWRFALPNTPEIFAAVISHPFTEEAWEELIATPLDQLVLEGAGIERYRRQLIDDALERAWPTEWVHEGDRFTVWTVDCPYSIGSEVAGELAKRAPTRFGTYFVMSEGQTKWGLRSLPEGMNVARVAEARGGGGHPRAAGFTVFHDRGSLF